MGFYVAKRVATIGVILVIISGLIFVITQGLPGNVARMIAGQFATPDVIAAIELKLRLNDPLLTQYWRWASGILSGDLGQSLIMERPIGPMLRNAWPTPRCWPHSIVLVAVFGSPSALSPRSSTTRRSTRHLGVHAARDFGPGVFLGIVLILVFAGYLHWLPGRRGHLPRLVHRASHWCCRRRR